MNSRRKISICHFLVVVEVILCFGQTSEYRNHKGLIRRAGQSGDRFVRSAHSRQSPDAVSSSAAEEMYNPRSDEENPAEVNNELLSQTPRRYDSSNNTPKEPRLLNDPSHSHSDHFLNCTHIGVERDQIEFLPNGSIHIPRISKTFEKSDFYRNEKGVVFICDELLTGDGNSSRYKRSYDHLSQEFVNCSGHIAIEKGSFETRPNQSVYVPVYDRVFDFSNHLIGANGELFICGHLESGNGNSSSYQQSYDHLSEEFRNCSLHIAIEKGSFETRPNQSVYVPAYDRVFDFSNHLIGENGEVFICNQLSNGNGNSSSYEQSYGHLSEEFVNCIGHIAIENGSFEVRPNQSVYVPVYDRVFDFSNHLIGENGQLFICPVFFPKVVKFERTFEIITITGLSISILFIVLYKIFFTLMESLRNLPGYCLFSLCIALLNAYCCFLLRRIGPNESQCRSLAISIMYFFLAAFFWMNVLSFDVWRSLKMATSKLRVSGNSMLWKRFLLYSLYAWLSPLVIVIFGILMTECTSVEYLHLEFDQRLCWFAKKGALLVYLAMPLVILMGLNFVFFTASFVMITRASMNTSENMATFWRRFFLFLRLAVIMGVAWIFGIIAAATNQLWLFYIFVLLNTLQGVFIFFSFAVNDKTKKALNKKLRKTSIFPSQITSQPAQSVTSL